MGRFTRAKKVDPASSAPAAEEEGEGEGDAAAAAESGTDKKKAKKEKKSKKQAAESAEEDDKEVGPEHGPRGMRQRGCTDCCCIIIFFVFFLGMAYISYLGWVYGEPYQILYGKDYLGNRCGVGAFANRSKTVYPRLDADLLAQSAIATTQPWNLVFYGLCVGSCPNIQSPTECFDDMEKCITRDYGTPAEWGAAGGSAQYYTTLPTVDVLNRCVPTVAVSSSVVPDRCAVPVCDNVTMTCDVEYPNLWLLLTYTDTARCEVKFQSQTVEQFATMNASPLTAQIAAKMAFLQSLVQALDAARQEIFLLGMVAPVVLGLAWLILLRLFARTIVWGAIILIAIALLALTIYLFIISGALDAVIADLANSTLSTTLTELAGNNTAILATLSADLSNATAELNAVTASATASIVQLAPTELSTLTTSMATGNPILYQIAAWVSLVLTIIYLIIMCVARAKIRLAATLVKESTVVIKDRPSSLLFPFVIIFMQVPVILYFFFFMILLGTADLQLANFVAGAGELITASSSYVATLEAMGADLGATLGGELGSGVSDVSGGLSGALAAVNGSLMAVNVSGVVATLPADQWWVGVVVLLYFLFGVLWTLESIKNVGYCSLSGNFSDWYFFRRDTSMRSKCPLARSFCRVLRYHLGTIFFGSFIIALIQLIRIVMEYIDRQTKAQQDANKMLKLAMKVTKCCLWCFEKTVKFITNYCYIYTAMQGSGFCRSCFATFALIVGQPAQLALNTFVRSILTLIQVLGIPAVCGWVCYQLLVVKVPPVLEPIYPAALVVLIAYVITTAWAVVMSCALDTIFVCCVRDKAEYKGAFMSDRLFKAFGFDKTERKEKRAAKRAAKDSKQQGESAGGGAEA